MTTKGLPTLAEIFALARQAADEARGDRQAKPSAKYVARAKALAEAIDLAKQVREAAFGPNSDPDMTLFEQETRRMALEPEPGFATLASLRYSEAAFFTYWNECNEPHIKTYWRELARRGLPFHRRDAAALALERGRITSQVDYETVTDALGDERFTDGEKKKLDKMLAAYGSAVARRPKRSKRSR